MPSDQYSFCVSMHEALARSTAPVPAGVEAVVARGMAEHPGLRHSSMSALRVALEELLCSRPRHRIVVAVSLLCALALIAVLAGRSSTGTRPTQAQQDSGLQARAHFDSADGLGLSESAARETEIFAAIHSAELAARDDLLAEGWLRLARLRSQSGSPAQAAMWARHGQAVAQGRAKSPALVADAAKSRGIIALLGEGLESATTELSVLQASLDKHDTAERHNLQGMLAAMSGDRKKAERLARRAVALAMNGGEPLDVANYMSNLATVSLDAEESISLLREALQIETRELGEDHPELTPTLFNLVDAYVAQGQYEPATLAAERAQ